MPPRKNGRGEEETPSEERGVSGLATRAGTDVKDKLLKANEGGELSDKARVSREVSRAAELLRGSDIECIGLFAYNMNTFLDMTD
ncbi:hypothetical protein NDU88_003949 [Pleurodeles waltl]|uniref:Uncharacterized protein n=1 Tax=Pleurodeles waltl TaxID=8319 RepID=A0AAV7QAV0_PLEWA|nr:hypothetical protein NDU88_003949 [Pleurodeles waltl]